MATGIPLKDAPQVDVKLQKVPVKIPSPYKAGHTLRANEAEALNAQYANAIRNAMAEDVKELVGEEDPTKHTKTVQDMVNKFVQDYDFGMGGGRTGDPVEREAMEIARNAVRDAIRRKGGNVGDYTGKQVSEKAREVLASEKHGATIRARAKEIVKQRENLSDIEI